MLEFFENLEAWSTRTIKTLMDKLTSLFQFLQLQLASLQDQVRWWHPTLGYPAITTRTFFTFITQRWGHFWTQTPCWADHQQQTTRVFLHTVKHCPLFNHIFLRHSDLLNCQNKRSSQVLRCSSWTAKKWTYSCWDFRLLQSYFQLAKSPRWSPSQTPTTWAACMDREWCRARPPPPLRHSRNFTISRSGH